MARIRSLAASWFLLTLPSCGSSSSAPQGAPVVDAQADRVEVSVVPEAALHDQHADSIDSPDVTQTDAVVSDVQGDVHPSDAGRDSSSDATLDAPIDVSPDVVPDTASSDVTVESSIDALVPDAPSGPQTITLRLASQNDAVASYLINQSPAAWNTLYGASVPVGRHFDTNHVSYYTALRFTNVLVPANATIRDARLSFYPTNEVDSSNNLWLNVYFEKAANSAPIDPSNYDQGRPDQRAKTFSFIDHWLVRCNASCTDITEYDCPQRKLDCWDRTVAFRVPKNLASMVQEVVSLADWKPGNAMTVLVINSATDSDGTKYRSSRSFTGVDPLRGLEYSPELRVTFDTP